MSIVDYLSDKLDEILLKTICQLVTRTNHPAGLEWKVGQLTGDELDQMIRTPHQVLMEALEWVAKIAYFARISIRT